MFFKTKIRQVLKYLIIFFILFLALLLTALFSLIFINQSKQQLQQNLSQGQLNEQRKIFTHLFGQNDRNLNQDQRIILVKNFLSDYHSPLAPYAERIVSLADTYKIHYGLVPAIGLIESGLCKTAPDNSAATVV
jgi:hypothetical protein